MTIPLPGIDPADPTPIRKPAAEREPVLPAMSPGDEPTPWAIVLPGRGPDVRVCRSADGQIFSPEHEKGDWRLVPGPAPGRKIDAGLESFDGSLTA